MTGGNPSVSVDTQKMCDGSFASTHGGTSQRSYSPTNYLHQFLHTAQLERKSTNPKRKSTQRERKSSQLERKSTRVQRKSQRFERYLPLGRTQVRPSRALPTQAQSRLEANQLRLDADLLHLNANQLRLDADLLHLNADLLHLN